MTSIFNPVLVTEREDYFRELGWTEFVPLYEALQTLSFHREFQVDLETTGLGSFIQERAHTLQIGIPDQQFVFDLETIPLDDTGTFAKLLKPARIIGHNLAFDLPYLYQAGIVPGECHDTLLAEQLIMLGLLPTPSRAKTLAALLQRYLGIDMDKSLQATINEGLKSVEDIEYAARDVWPLFDLEAAMEPRLKKMDLMRRMKLEDRYLRMHVYLEFSGAYKDPERFKKWCRRVEAEEYILEQHMIETYGDINWASTQQVGPLLKEHGIEIINEDSGALMTGEDVLKLRSEPIARDLLKYRKAQKLVTTYGRKWFHYVMPDGRIHTKYKQLVDTGRTSSGDTRGDNKFDSFDATYVCKKPFPNMQNLPRNKEFRAMFAGQGKNVLVVSDYSSQESVILADQSEDPAMLDFFLRGDGDMHCYVTRLIWPELAELTDEEIKASHSEQRTLAKTAAFAIAYGGNWSTIVDNVGCSPEAAQHVYNRYMEVFHTLPVFFKECFEFAWRNCYMPTDPLTRGKRFFDGAVKFREQWGDRLMWEEYRRLQKLNGDEFLEMKERLKPLMIKKSELMKNSVNTRIQGTAAVMSKLAGIYFFDWILKKGLFGIVKVPIFVHDEWVAECPEKYAAEVAANLQECMERAGKHCLKHLTIRAEPKIVKHWEK